VRDVGDQIDIRHEVRDADGALTAATVAVTVTAPAGTTSTPTVTTTSTGIYDASFTATTVGVWRWTWTVSGAVVDVAHGQVDVADPAPNTYATLTQLRHRVGADGTTDRDETLQSKLNAAARTLDTDTGRRPGGFELAATATARTYRTRHRVVCDRDGEKLLIDEVGSLTGLIVEVGDGTTWTTVTDYEVDPPNALADSEPVTGLLRINGSWGCQRVRVTAKWGWPAVPNQVEEAVLIAAHRLYGRKDSPDGISAGASDLGGIRLARVDPDYARLVQALTMPGIA
jgi:hypothetical protein